MTANSFLNRSVFLPDSGSFVQADAAVLHCCFTENGIHVLMFLMTFLVRGETVPKFEKSTCS